MYRSNLPDLVDSCKDLEVNELFEEWVEKYKLRTFPNFVAKSVALISSVGLGVSLYTNTDTVKIISFVGIGSSLCYLFWKYLTTNLEKEKEKYFALCDYVSIKNSSLA